MPPPPNPWLRIPLAHYEGHMRAPVVAQLAPLAEAFAEALALTAPRSVAVLGVAGGNGLDAVDPAITQRVVGIDINAAYLDATRERHGGRLSLELHHADLSAGPLRIPAVDLVHAALIFEHARVGACLDNALALVSHGGSLSVVLQLPPRDCADTIADTGFDTIQQLDGHFTLVDCATFTGALADRAFRPVHQRIRALPSGKAFWCALFTQG